MYRRLIAAIALLLAAATSGRAQDAAEKVDRPEEERQTIRAVERLQGWVHYDYESPGLPVTGVDFGEISDNDLQLLFKFPQLDHVIIRRGRISDVGLMHIARLSKLKFLHIARSTITETGMASIASLTHLEDLELLDCDIAETGLGQLTKLVHLKKLNLRQSTISDTGLPHLERLSGLRDLDVSGTHITAAGVAQLKEAFPYAIVVTDRGQRKMEHEYFFEFLAVAASVTLVGVGVGYLVVRSPRLRSRPRTWKAAVIVAAIGVIAFGLMRMAPPMCPVQEGDAGAFWIHVCQIDVGAKHPRRPMGRFYQPRDGWFIYYDQGFHGQFLYRVPESECMALFPKVVERLRNAPPGWLPPYVEQGFRAWVLSGADPNDAAGLLAAIREARLAQVREKDPKLFEYVRSDEEHFDERWARIGRYHWNVWFEFAYLTALILFVAWPWLRNASRMKWAIQLGLLPSLFCLPYWLGYAALTFTSAGPSGGVLYPWLIAPLRGMPWSELDTMILRAIPHPLESLSQTPGPMWSLSNMGGVGPVSMVCVGLIVFAAIIWGPFAVHFVRSQLGESRQH